MKNRGPRNWLGGVVSLLLSCASGCVTANNVSGGFLNRGARRNRETICKWGESCPWQRLFIPVPLPPVSGDMHKLNKKRFVNGFTWYPSDELVTPPEATVPEKPWEHIYTSCEYKQRGVANRNRCLAPTSFYHTTVGKTQASYMGLPMALGTLCSMPVK